MLLSLPFGDLVVLIVSVAVKSRLLLLPEILDFTSQMT